MTTQRSAHASLDTHDLIVDGREPDRPAELEVEVSTDGQFAPDVPAYARQKIRAAAKHCHDPILRVEVRLVRYPDPALPRPVVARATLNLNGRLVRAQTTAAGAREALDHLQHTLGTAIERLARHADHHKRHEPGPLHPSDREIRTLGAEAGSCTVDEAIATMDALDRDFQLFRDVDTGEDSMLNRAGPTGYHLAQARHRPLGRTPETAVSVEIEPAPHLTLAQAAERLACTGQPHLFFTDTDSGAGTVLHVRHDGQYGLVTIG